jgi:Zn-dependent protease/CBS domain-containing protein
VNHGIKIGKLFGIQIRIDWSWIIIFLLVTWNLSVVFSTWHEDWNPALAGGIALGASLLFFGSVLAHELAHSLVAKGFGVPVREITLFLFGGVSNIREDPPSPKAEFLITIVGPITSITLGFIFLFISSLLTDKLPESADQMESFLSGLSPVATLLFWLGPINILVGIFNMIPGFPLDGGRILRSVLWVATGNLKKATRWASYSGRLISWMLIIFGIYLVFGGRLPDGLWLILIGWFIGAAATQSYQQMQLKKALEGVSVSEIMRNNPPSISRSTSVDQLVHEHIMGGDDSSFPVSEDGSLKGLVTLEDVRKVSREEWENTPVGQIMTDVSSLKVAHPDQPASKAFQILAESDYRQLPVVGEDGDLVGLFRRRDVIRWLQLQED